MDSRTLDQGITSQAYQPQSSSLFEKLVGLSSIVSLILTFYFKLITKKGLFILNPCHITLIIMTVLLFSRSTPLMLKLHTYWTAWLFGAYLAVLIPHLDGIDSLEVLLYYYEHLLIVPVGPIILYRRYGFKRPRLLDQLAGFATLIIYQLTVLTSLSRLLKVNLNFSLCHSSADPFYALSGYLYYACATIHLNFASYVFRWFSYLIANLWAMLFSNSKTRTELKEEE